MKTNEFKIIITCFIIFLIVLIPINTSLAVYTLNIDQLSSTNGYVEDLTITKIVHTKGTDTISLGITATGDNVPDIRYVRRTIGMQPYIDYFANCQGDNHKQCQETFGYSVNLMSQYIIQIYNSSSDQVLNQKSFFVIPDNNPPLINNFNVNFQDSKLNIVLNITDNGLSISNDQLSTLSISSDDLNLIKSRIKSGLKEIKIMYDDQELWTHSFSQPTQEFNQNIQIDPPDIQGEINLQLTAEDNLGNTATSQNNLVIDTQSPQIDSSGLSLYKNGQKLKGLSNTFNEVSAILKIDADDVMLNSVKANFKNLGEHDQYYSASCYFSEEENKTICEWDNLSLKISNSGTFNIPVDFRDINNNQGNPSSVSISLQLDTKGPLYQNLRTPKQLDDGSYLITSHTTFIVDVDEDNFNNNLHPKLNLTSINKGVVDADECNNMSNNHYNCTWNINGINVPSGKYLISLIGTKDLLNNLPQNTLMINVSADTQPPQLNSSIVKIKFPNAAQDNFGNRIVKGSSFRIEFKVKDKHSVSAEFNLSNLINEGNHETINCNPINNDIWLCNYTTHIIDRNVIGNISYKIKVFDEVGNYININDQVFVYGINNQTNNDFWTYEVACTPSKLDRKVSSLINLKTFCKIHLIPKDPSAKVIKIGHGELSNDNSSGAKYISSINILNDEEGTTDPILDITFDTVEFKTNKISFVYPLLILSEFKSNGNSYVTKYYEHENVSINIPLYNLPLGEYSQSMKDKIIEIRDSSLVANTWIRSLQKMIHLLEKLCELVSLFNTIRIATKKILALFDPLGYSPTSYGTVIDLKNQDQGFMYQTNNFLFGRRGIFSVCNYISCSRSLWGPILGKLKLERLKGLQGKINSFVSKKLILSTGKNNCKGFQIGNSSTLASLKNQNCNALSLNMFPSSPKNSLVLSIATLCIPGVLNNLERWRVIQCSYGNCLINSMKSKLPSSVCDKQRSYRECKYIFGEIFQLIPFANFIKSMLAQIKAILYNPIALISAGASILLGCNHLVHVPGTLSYTACWYYKLASETLTVFNQIKTYIQQDWSNFFGLGDDECDIFNDNLNSIGLAKEKD